MADQLGLYNEALRLIGERKLLSLSENREPRRVLDDIWNDGAINYCLEQGQWAFAMRAVKIDASTTVIPAFGYAHAFDKPNDHIRTAAVAADERFNTPLTTVLEEVGFWFSDATPIYIRYVSNDPNYGNNLLRWPQTFTRFVAAYLASQAVWTLTQSTEKKQLCIQIARTYLSDARSKDAMEESTAFMPQQTWTVARSRGFLFRDRGNRGQLIG